MTNYHRITLRPVGLEFVLPHNGEEDKDLFITEATVKSHLVQVFAKLGVDSRTAAAAEGRRRGVIR